MDTLDNIEDKSTSRQLAVLVKAAAQQVYQLRRIALRADDIPLQELEKIHVELVYLEVDIIKLSDEMTIKFARETVEQSDASKQQRGIRKAS